MATFTQDDRRKAVEQTLASWRIEGFEPDAEYLALLDRYIAGELTTEDLRRHLDETEMPAIAAA